MFGYNAAVCRQDLVGFAKFIDACFGPAHLIPEFAKAGIDQRVGALGFGSLGGCLVGEISLNHGFCDLRSLWRRRRCHFDIDDVGLLGALDLDRLSKRGQGLGCRVGRAGPG